MLLSAALIVLGLLVLIAAAYGHYWYSPAPLLPPLSATIRQACVRVRDTERTYLIYVPEGLRAKAALVLLLHGSGMDGARMRLCTGYSTVWLIRMDLWRSIPMAIGEIGTIAASTPTFPAKRENIDDMTFIRTLIARMKAEHSVSDKRVYVFGYSNGGHMAFRLAIEAPEEIAAVAAVAASLPTPDASSCSQEGRTSRVMLINGTADPINPYQGGIVRLFGFASRGTVMSSIASAQNLAEPIALFPRQFGASCRTVFRTTRPTSKH
jgi:polyhydroxybutyrate depolymerase